MQMVMSMRLEMHQCCEACGLPLHTRDEDLIEVALLGAVEVCGGCGRPKEPSAEDRGLTEEKRSPL
jgi:hypothetical protein